MRLAFQAARQATAISKKDDIEVALLDFWRKLSPEAQGVILNIIDGWSDRMTRSPDDKR